MMLYKFIIFCLYYHKFKTNDLHKKMALTQKKPMPFRKML
jgi:hypothetical protein